MENINFLLRDTINGDNKLVLEELNTFTSSLSSLSSLDNQFIISDMESHYTTTYNVKQIAQIMSYYKLQKGKATKNEMIQMILFFEIDPVNKSIVQQRLRLWQNILELKNDPYFSKYILFC